MAPSSRHFAMLSFFLSNINVARNGIVKGTEMQFANLPYSKPLYLFIAKNCILRENQAWYKNILKSKNESKSIMRIGIILNLYSEFANLQIY